MKYIYKIIIGVLIGHLIVGYWELNFNPLTWDNQLRYLATVTGWFASVLLIFMGEFKNKNKS